MEENSCSVCNQVFPSKSELNGYEKNSSLICDDCKKKLVLGIDLNQHYEKMHLQLKPHECSFCSLRFMTKPALKNHQDCVHLKLRPYSCEQCDRTFSIKVNLLTHQKRVHSGKRKSAKPQEESNFICEPCNKSFKKKQNLIMHMVVHSGIKNFSCSKCRHKFFHKHSCFDHELKCLGPPSEELLIVKNNQESGNTQEFMCRFCSRTFTNKRSLRNHFLVHTGSGVKEYPCRKCGSVFYKGSWCREHEQTCSSGVSANRATRSKEIAQEGFQPSTFKDRGNIKCGSSVETSNNEELIPSELVCVKIGRASKTKRTKSKMKFLEPIEAFSGHSNELQFETNRISTCKEASPLFCEVCGKTFLSKASLYQHTRRVHRQVKPKECLTCGAKFVSKPELVNHENSVHLKLKPYHCEKCGKCFTAKANLRTHEKKVHSSSENKQQFTCEFCSRLFNQKRNYENHLLLHSGIKNFACSKCGMKFFQNRWCQKHESKCLGPPTKELPADKDKKCPKRNRNICEYCSKEFKKRRTLESHVIIHEEEINFACENCGEAFYKREWCIEHEEICFRNNCTDASAVDVPSHVYITELKSSTSKDLAMIPTVDETAELPTI